MFFNDKLSVVVEIPVPSDIRTYCISNDIDLASYLCFLLSFGCIDHLRNNHDVLTNNFDSAFIKSYFEKE